MNNTPFTSPAEFMLPASGPAPAPMAVGPQGAPAAPALPGTPGANGSNCWCLLAQDFVTPAYGSNIQITVALGQNAGGNPTDAFGATQIICIASGGSFRVVSVDAATLVTITPYAGTVVSAVINAGSVIAPSGFARNQIKILEVVTATGDTTTYAMDYGTEALVITKTAASAGSYDVTLPSAVSMSGQSVKVFNLASYGAIKVGTGDMLNSNPTGYFNLALSVGQTFTSDGSGWWSF